MPRMPKQAAVSLAISVNRCTPRIKTNPLGLTGQGPDGILPGAETLYGTRSPLLGVHHRRLPTKTTIPSLSRAGARTSSCPRRLFAPGFLPRQIRRAVLCLALASVLLGLYNVVPAYIASQEVAIAASAARQGVPPRWLAAVFYNEILGTEDAVLQEILPGESGAAPALRQVLLGLHFCTLKQVQWQTKSAMALLGGDPTLGPAGIRVTVGREIRREVKVAGGSYIESGWLERPSMVLDLVNPATALEYLAGNLRRGQDRLVWTQRGDWAASARWHNTGVVYDSAIVRPADWVKGSRYIARVEEYLPEIARLMGDEWPNDMDAADWPVMGWGNSGQALRWPPVFVAQ
jgi:hypothetical protein